MPPIKRRQKIMGAAAIYLIIGVLGLLACISINISGQGDVDGNAGVDKRNDLDASNEENTTEEGPEEKSDTDQSLWSYHSYQGSSMYVDADSRNFKYDNEKAD